MTAIEFENISKQYRLGLVSTRTLSHDLNRWWTVNVRGKEDPYLKIGETNDRAHRGESDYVWALKDINFKVEQGDVVGIIGKNGAGKSTLLKLLSKVTAPTTGTIKARGRIGSLLEVGTGFHPEMTGRENIYMNGAILGMSKHEITRKLDEIVDFSGCERYLDTPVKRYSSGMMVRLGFAVAAHLDPEILVVDEVLAVGDAEFQKKAIGKMKSVSEGEGRTVLFVSHNMASIRSLCNKGVLLDKGRIDYIGGANDTIERYLHRNTIVAPGESIADIFKVNNSDIQIEGISINGIETSEYTLEYPSHVLDIQVRGFAKGHYFLDIETMFFDESEVLLARHSNGLYSGNVIEVIDDAFVINSHIELPEGIAEGEYLIHLDLTHPKVATYATTKFPIKLKVSGSQTDQGFQIRRNFYGYLCIK